MKICTTQIRPVSGDIGRSIHKHETFIVNAAEQGTDLILFPELSLTGYEPEWAQEWAMDTQDPQLDGFQILSDTQHITICIGIPAKSEAGVLIGMLIFQPNQARRLYAKQHLHADEMPWFVPGNTAGTWKQNGGVLTPAICYESLLPEHAAAAGAEGISVYLASVAKSAAGLEKARVHYPAIARQYGMAVVLSNSIGFCDNFVSAGGSAVWDKNGICKSQLNSEEEGMLLFDTKTGAAITI